MKLVEPAIYELLKMLAGGRVYAMRAPQNATAPFIIFQRTDSERWRSINGPSGVAQVYMQIDVYGTEYYQAKNLAAEIEEILDGYRDEVIVDNGSPQQTVNICGISLQNDLDLFEQTDQPFLIRNSATYLVTYNT